MHHGFSKRQSRDNTVQIGERAKIVYNKPSHTRDPVCCNCTCISSDIYEACSNNPSHNIVQSPELFPAYSTAAEENMNQVFEDQALPTDNVETGNAISNELDLNPVSEDQIEKVAEFEVENITVSESAELAEENSHNPVLEEANHWETAAAENYENNSENYVRDCYLQALGLLRELEVEETMKPGSHSTIVFDPCENTSLEVLANTEIINRIEELEDRILRLESKILKLEEINSKQKSRDILPLSGSMVIESCSRCNG